MQTFDEIYLFDLHGSSIKKSTCPEGTRDDNVFDITPGVAIAILIRREGSHFRNATVHHADLFGIRSYKYDVLRSSSLKMISDVAPVSAPDYLFIMQDSSLKEEYEQWPKVTEIFGLMTTGFKTHRDHFAVAFSLQEMQTRLEDLLGTKSDDVLTTDYDLPGADGWTLSEARNKLKAAKDCREFLTQAAYRPFDNRYCFLSEIIMNRPRPELIQHGLKSNLMFITGRQGQAVGDGEWQIVYVSRFPADTNLFRRGGNQIFPLWIYPTEHEEAIGIERQVNLNPAFMQILTARLGEIPTPETVFNYAYAVFHAPMYRERYASFLKIDFPRLPLPSDHDSFDKLSELGARLVALHLLEAPELAQHGIAFPVAGDHIVKKMRVAERYLPPTSDGKPGRVRLNDSEYFDNVPPEAWEFCVGGYQPAFKWLDDRAGRALVETDITHYRRMIAALRETAALLPHVDAAFRRMIDL